LKTTAVVPNISLLAEMWALLNHVAAAALVLLNRWVKISATCSTVITAHPAEVRRHSAQSFWASEEAKEDL
jgi:phosphoenolpyruvate carboxylase